MSDTQTPSERIIASAKQTEIITDSLGRKLTINNLNALDQMRLLRAAGPVQASNQPYFNLVECAAMVVAIDGTPRPQPQNERQIDAAVQALGDEGMVAVMLHRARKIREIENAAEQAMDEGAPPVDPLAPSA